MVQNWTNQKRCHIKTPIENLSQKTTEKMRLQFLVLYWLSICQCKFGVAQLNVNKHKAEKFTKEGISYVQQKNPEEAKIAFQTAAELEPTNSQRW